MNRKRERHPPLPRIAGLAAGILAALGALAHPVAADAQDASLGTVYVSTCADNGRGSLRAVIAGAVDGITVDLRKLKCGTITLTTGALQVAARNLHVAGPGAGQLTIDGNTADGVITHSGTGLLQISGLTVTNGRRTDADGGCVASSGSLRLDDVAVSACSVHGTSGWVHGGGIAAAGAIELHNSTVTGCWLVADMLHSGASALGAGIYAGGNLTLRKSSLSNNRFSTAPDAVFSPANGGGAFVMGDLDMRESTIAENAVFGMAGVEGRGGGIEVRGDALIVASTFSGNTASYGGAAVLQTGALIDSTISGNEARRHTGGIVVSAPFEILGSTIVSYSVPQEYSDGVYIREGTVDIVSSIITGGDGVSQVGGNLFSGAAVYGDHNIITGPTRLDTLPADTITSDPLLLPLADNGGSTKTHALRRSSPALDAGNNSAGTDFDQRASPYTRSAGCAPDIGAYEQQSKPAFRSHRDAATSCGSR